MRDNELFERFREEQLRELISYLMEEEQQIAGEVIDHVRNENFTSASMSAGELEYCRAFRRRAERNLKSRS